MSDEAFSTGEAGIQPRIRLKTPNQFVLDVLETRLHPLLRLQGKHTAAPRMHLPDARL